MWTKNVWWSFVKKPNKRALPLPSDNHLGLIIFRRNIFPLLWFDCKWFYRFCQKLENTRLEAMRVASYIFNIYLQQNVKEIRYSIAPFPTLIFGRCLVDNHLKSFYRTNHDFILRLARGVGYGKRFLCGPWTVGYLKELQHDRLVY